jgi:hypothetical protein
MECKPTRLSVLETKELAVNVPISFHHTRRHKGPSALGYLLQVRHRQKANRNRTWRRLDFVTES